MENSYACLSGEEVLNHRPQKPSPSRSCHLNRRRGGFLVDPTWWHWPRSCDLGRTSWVCLGRACIRGCIDRWSKRRTRNCSANPRREPGRNGTQIAACSDLKRRPKWWSSAEMRNEFLAHKTPKVPPNTLSECKGPINRSLPCQHRRSKCSFLSCSTLTRK